VCVATHDEPCVTRAKTFAELACESQRLSHAVESNHGRAPLRSEAQHHSHTAADVARLVGMRCSMALGAKRYAHCGALDLPAHQGPKAFFQW